MSEDKTITCLKELKEKKELQKGDIVKFTVKGQIIQYEVGYLHLKNLKTENTIKYNDEIFKILNLDKNKLTKKIYKYEPNNSKNCLAGYWPQIKNHDFPALTRLVAELYRIIEKREPIFTKFTRFEIMEI